MIKKTLRYIYFLLNKKVSVYKILNEVKKFMKSHYNTDYDVERLKYKIRSVVLNLDGLKVSFRSDEYIKDVFALLESNVPFNTRGDEDFVTTKYFDINKNGDGTINYTEAVTIGVLH